MKYKKINLFDVILGLIILTAILFHGFYMYEDRLPQVQGWWLSDREYILKDRSTAFGNPDYRSEPLDKKWIGRDV